MLPEIVKGFERESRATVTVSFGSSGNFVAQIQNGAPYDIYLSADIDYPRQLVASKHADASSLYRYATGRIVLWARKDSGIDVQRGLSVLKDAAVKRIAIANAKLAPHGRAAEAALRREHLYDAIRRKLVIGDNISQTAQLVDSATPTLASSRCPSPAVRRCAPADSISRFRSQPTHPSSRPQSSLRPRRTRKWLANCSPISNAPSSLDGYTSSVS